MKQVLILGGTTYDSIIYLDQLPEPVPQTIHYAPFNETLGSTGAGKALNLTKLNIPNILHSIIGDDFYGEQIISRLQHEGVQFEYDLDPKGTERHVNLMDKKGGRISIFVSQSSSELDLNLIRLEELIRSCDLVVLNIISYTKSLIELCRKYNKPVWTDLHDYDGNNLYHEDYIQAAEYIFMSSDNMNDYKSVMERLHTQGKKLIVCTHGNKGATCLTEDGRWLSQGIIPDYHFQDANGAGDSFFSGFLYGHLQHRPVEQCLKLAAICAGLCVTSKDLVSPALSEDYIWQEYRKYFSEDHT